MPSIATVSDACADSDCNQATEICVRGEINGFACVECFPGYQPSDDGHTCIGEFAYYVDLLKRDSETVRYHPITFNIT